MDNMNTNTNTNKIISEDILTRNKLLFQNLFLENLSRKEKDFSSFKDLSLLEEIEKNLVCLLKDIPKDKVDQLIKEFHI